MIAGCKLALPPRVSAGVALLALWTGLTLSGISYAQYPSSYGHYQTSYGQYPSSYGQYPSSYGYHRPGYPTPGAYPQPGGYPQPGSYYPSSGFGYSSFSSTSLSSSGQPTLPDSPEQRQKLFDQDVATLKHIDRNNNGIIEPDELTEGKSHSHKEMFEGVIRKVGLPPIVPMAITVVRDRLMLAYRVTPNTPSPSPGTPGSTPTATPGSPSAATVASLVPGFSVAMNSSAVPGFGSPAALAVAGSPSSLAALTTGDRERDKKLRSIAVAIMQKYDRNKNGTLEKDEYSDTKIDVKAADRNRDGIITPDELTAYYIESSRSRNSSGPSNSDSRNASSPATAGSSDKEKQKEKDKEKSAKSASSSASQQGPAYRFRTPSERLPKGIPDWFIEKDVDKDGQVSMAEYASQWTDGMAADFGRYDLNNDGLITAPECLQGLQALKNELSKREPSRGPDRRTGPPGSPGLALTPSRDRERPRGR